MLKGRKLTPIYRVIQEENSVFWEVMSVMCPIPNGDLDSAVFESADTKAVRIARERLLAVYFTVIFI